MYYTSLNSALHPSGVSKSSTSFGWGKGRNVASVGWQLTLSDPIWHVSSRSGEVSCKRLYFVYLLYLLVILQSLLGEFLL